MLNPDWLEIMCGYRTVSVKDHTLDIYLPTVTMVHESLFYVRKESDQVLGKALTQEDLEDLKAIILRPAELSVLDNYEDKSKQLSREIETSMTLGKRQIAQRKLDQLESNKLEADSKWSKMMSLTVSGFSSTVQTQFCFYRCVYDHTTREPLWSSFDEFSEDYRGFFVRAVYSAYVDFLTHFDDKCLRSIAKDGFYRMIPQLQASHLISSFDNIKEMSIVAMKLLHWITYYNSVIQNARDKCPDHILQDDILFDEWAERQRKGLTPEQTTNSSVVRSGGKRRESLVIM
jgi:hypothetical protein